MAQPQCVHHTLCVFIHTHAAPNVSVQGAHDMEVYTCTAHFNFYANVGEKNNIPCAHSERASASRVVYFADFSKSQKAQKLIDLMVNKTIFEVLGLGNGPAQQTYST